MSFIQRLGSCFVSFPSTPKMEGEEGGQCYKYVDQHGVQYCAYMEDDLSCEKSALVALDKLVEGDASDRILDAPDLSTPVVFGSGRAHKKVSFTTRDNAIRGEILLAMDREGRSYAFGVAIPATIVGSSVPTEAINNFLAPVW